MSDYVIEEVTKFIKEKGLGEFLKVLAKIIEDNNII